MFSANENIALRQYKKRVVDYVESCLPEDALDLGTMVMAMQVSCKAPGCVPLETAIVIVFPKIDQELVPGLPESRGGNYKTKVLKPMAEVTQDDVLEALPPEFPGGRRSLEKLCLQARDVMLGQITQLFAEEDQAGRKLMAEYLQQCLQEYTDRDCLPPEWGEPFPPLEENNNNTEENKAATSQKEETKPEGVTKTGNFVFKRPVDEPVAAISKNTPGRTPRSILSTTSTRPSTSNTVSKPPNDSTVTQSSQSIVQQLGERQHAPGIRNPGCPCCDPDNANNLIDEMMAL